MLPSRNASLVGLCRCLVECWCSFAGKISPPEWSKLIPWHKNLLAKGSCRGVFLTALLSRAEKSGSRRWWWRVLNSSCRFSDMSHWICRNHHWQDDHGSSFACWKLWLLIKIVLWELIYIQLLAYTDCTSTNPDLQTIKVSTSVLV